jgi:CBS domain-containing protein
MLGEAALKGGKPLYELIVAEARRHGMAGATVTRGIMGFGANSMVHTAKILRLSEDLPVVVEIVDVPERMARFLPVVQSLIDEGSIVLFPGRAIMHCTMRIRDVMTTDVATVSPDAPLSLAAKLLLDRGVKALPVVDGQRIVGILTGGDLLQRAAMALRLEVQRQLPETLRDEHIRALDLGGLKAGDVMSSPVQTIDDRTTVRDALRIMAERKIKRLPVLGGDKRLVGIVSRIDVLRTIARAATLTRTLPELPKGLATKAGEVMYREVPVVPPDAPLTEVLERIVATPLRRVVVVDDELVVQGLVMDRDLVSRFARIGRPGLLRSLLSSLSPARELPSLLEGTARDIMKTEVYSVTAETPLSDVVTLMVEKKAKRLVVLDDRGRLEGMIDRDAVMRVLAG